MKGLELSKKFFYECGRPAIEQKLPHLMRLLAFGLAGEGSECFGYDDMLSRDHDFEPGFCIFTPEPDGRTDFTRKDFFELERVYSYLPREFEGVPRLTLLPVGGSRHGVMSVGDFYRKNIGRADVFDSLEEWFALPEHYLAQATNGEVFEDNLGDFTRIRNSLLNMPGDVRKKKLAGDLLLAAQAGNYNYTRCIGHGQTAAAQLSVFDFTKHVTNVMFELCGRYAPFYKWRFRALSDLPGFCSLCDMLEFIISSQNDGEYPKIKTQVIGDIFKEVMKEIKNRGLSSADAPDVAAYEINSGIEDEKIRNMDILAAAEE